MARSLRKAKGGIVYHVINRGPVPDSVRKIRRKNLMMGVTPFADSPTTYLGISLS